MGQTKRKRRSKHRGNAAGAVEVRGRTSKPRPGTARATSGGRNGRGPARELKAPTLQSSMLKAAIGAVVLFAFFRFLSKGTTTGQALTMSLVALLLYTPIMFLTDRWIYQRKLRQAGAGKR